MTELADIDNPYWAAVKGHVSSTRDPTWHTFTVGDTRGEDSFYHAYRLRRKLIPPYTWTVTAPATVKFVVGHCTTTVVDPIAGTGYWVYLLAQCHIRVTATDIEPPRQDGYDNAWHPNAKCWVPVLQADAVDAALMADRQDTLLLSWPPYGDSIGVKVLSAFPGNRLVYIGEGEGGACADDDFFTLLNSEWTQYAMHDPVQFPGLHDYITVYDRNQPLPNS